MIQLSRCVTGVERYANTAPPFIVLCCNRSPCLTARRLLFCRCCGCGFICLSLPILCTISTIVLADTFAISLPPRSVIRAFSCSCRFAHCHCRQLLSPFVFYIIPYRFGFVKFHKHLKRLYKADFVYILRTKTYIFANINQFFVRFAQQGFYITNF